MENSVAKLARELLGLETLFVSNNGLTELEEERWNELIKKIFGKVGMNPTVKTRRSFRMPVSVAISANFSLMPVASIRVDSKQIDGQLTNVSLLGVSIQCEIPGGFRGEPAILLDTVTISARKVQLDLTCRIVRLWKNDGLDVLGMEIVDSNSPESRIKYNTQVYHPIYISYLESLARGE
jgi:hypothetical protein